MINLLFQNELFNNLLKNFLFLYNFICMGACNCINKELVRSDAVMDTQRAKELSIYNYKIINFFTLIATLIKNNPKIMFLIHRVQARIRGLIARNKVKSSMAAPKGFAGRDNYGKFHYVQHSKIV